MGKGYILSAAMIWGTLGVIGASLNLSGYTGFEVAALRIILSACALCVALPAVWAEFVSAVQKIPVRLIVQALSGVVAYNVFYFLAIERVGVTLSVCLLYSSPFWTLLFVRALFGAKTSPAQLALAGCAIGGVVATVGLNLEDSPLSGAGVVYGLAAGASYALYYVIGKRALDDISPNVLLVSSFLVGAIGFLFIPESWSALAKLVNETRAPVWTLFVGISLIGTVLSYFLFTRGIQTTSPPAISILTTVEPLTAVVLAAVLFSEELSALQYLGLCLIIGASAASGFLGRRAPTPS